MPAATDFYSATKLAAERFVRAYSAVLGTTVLRFVAPYGPGQRNRMIPRMIDSVRDGKPIALNAGGRPRMNPIYVADVVRVIVAALESDGDQLVNVAGDDTVTIRELGELIGRVVKEDASFEQGDASVAGDIVCENQLMRTVFGLTQLTGLEDGLTRTAA